MIGRQELCFTSSEIPVFSLGLSWGGPAHTFEQITGNISWTGQRCDCGGRGASQPSDLGYPSRAREEIRESFATSALGRPSVERSRNDLALMGGRQETRWIWWREVAVRGGTKEREKGRNGRTSLPTECILCGCERWVSVLHSGPPCVCGLS